MFDPKPPHSSHKMTRWTSDIVTLLEGGEPRFGSIRECKICHGQQARTVAGSRSFPEILQPCTGKNVNDDYYEDDYDAEE